MLRSLQKKPNAWGGNGGRSARTNIATEIKKKERRQRRIRIARLWNDESVSTPLLQAIVSFFIVSIMGAVILAMGIVMGYPAAPLLGTFPTHGYYLQIPDVCLLLGPLVLMAQSILLVKVMAGFSILFTIFDLYALMVNIWWFCLYFLGTLPAAAKSHQSLVHTIPYIIVLLFLVFLHLVAFMSLLQVVTILPDLKRFYNLVRVNEDGEELDDDDNLDQTAVDEDESVNEQS
jgi:hypothetical protein